MLALAGGDCLTRTHIIGRLGLERLEDLKGKRLGINRQRATTGFVARLLARRMGWDPTLDISILEFGRDAESLKNGLVVPSSPTSVRSRRSSEKLPTPFWAHPRLERALAGNIVMVER